MNQSIIELDIAKRLGPSSAEVRYKLAKALAPAKRPREAAQEQAEFEPLDALVQKAKQKLSPESYRNSSERSQTTPRLGEEPGSAGSPP